MISGTFKKAYVKIKVIAYASSGLNNGEKNNTKI